MHEGDVLTVTKPDRLARSTAELLAIEADLLKRGIGLVVLSSRSGQGATVRVGADEVGTSARNRVIPSTLGKPGN